MKIISEKSKFYYNSEALEASPLERPVRMDEAIHPGGGGVVLPRRGVFSRITHLPPDCKRQGYSSQEEIKHFVKTQNFTTTERVSEELIKKMKKYLSYLYD